MFWVEDLSRSACDDESSCAEFEALQDSDGLSDVTVADDPRCG